MLRRTLSYVAFLTVADVLQRGAAWRGVARRGVGWNRVVRRGAEWRRVDPPNEKTQSQAGGEAARTNIATALAVRADCIGSGTVYVALAL